ncbi:unnamed protein product [Heligmosomoides polygyrus]|uniref:guanylate cyclase n=1 Tax=Heligmosomoides polygyrus TaxID=6339 RepID=A0A183F783_HELPZ|nr:unnamed protein product [Heligmosomoides polygyrus]
MRKLDHDNVNRFIGLSIDGPEYIAIWRMCPRGTLQELVSKGSLLVDSFFIFCIMRDIAEASKEGDVFSFAIISSEVVTRKEAWNIHERKERTDVILEMLYMIRKGGHDPLRPNLESDGEINPALLHLIRDCWAEDPSDRPTADTVCSTLKVST